VIASSKLGTLPAIGATVDRYQIIAEVAHGGMAVVYAARRVGAGRFDKLLAIKMMLPHLITEHRFVQMFLDEASIAARIQHPNVVQVFDVGSFDRSPYLVMEYLRGQALSTVLRSEPPLARGLVYAIFAAAAEGLHAAHEARASDGSLLGVVHRDVSPQNIHVGYDGTVKVIDFGIAAAEGRISSTRTGEVKGKIAYMAPEQLHKKFAVDRRTDLWALGVLAWSTFAGGRLFTGESDTDTIWNVMHGPIDDIGAIDPELPAELAGCIMACLSREPHARPASAAEIAACFRRAALAQNAGAAELAAHMQAAFRDERAAEEARISDAVRGASAQPSEAPRTAPTAVVPARRGGLALAAGTIGIAVIAIAALVVVMASNVASEDEHEPPPRVAETPAREESVTAGATHEPTPEAEPISLDVSPEVREVWIGSERHDERPVRLSIANGTAELTLVSGRRRETIHVDRSDDGRTLEFSTRRARVRRTAPSEREAPAASPMTASMDAIIRDPL
jgi:serine/threonine-protein kinase